MNGREFILSYFTTLLLTTLTISITVGLTSAQYPGPDYDEEATWGSGWELIASVKGFYQENNPYLYSAVEHKAHRSAWYTIQCIGKMTIYWKTNKYNYSEETDAWDITKSTPGTYTWGKTKAKAEFRNWLTGATWWAYTPWATVVASP